MKALRFLSLCVLLLLVAACSGEEVALPTPALISEVATSLPTHTPVSPTATATTLPATNTPLPPTLPPTLTSTPEPAPTATALPTATPSVPFTQGTLYFIWRPDPKPAPEDMGPEEVPAKKLYRTIPGTTPNQWTLEPVLTDIRCFCQPKLSPDKTNLAFIQTEDANQDGGFYDDDAHNIYTYNFAENRLTRLAIPNFSHQFSWASDNHTLLFKSGANLGLASFDSSELIPLTDYPREISEGEQYENIRSLTGSPNGHLQIITAQPSVGTSAGGLMPLGNVQVVLYDIAQKVSIPIFEASGFGLEIVWSPDSEWVAATLNFGTGGLYIANAKTLEAIQLVTGEDLTERVFPPTWSFHGEWLAFIQDESTLWTWNRPSHASNQLASKNFVGVPAWATNEDTVAASFTTNNGGGILLIQPTAGTELELPLSVIPTGTPIWTPDDQWLLFPATQGETSGYYLIHRQGGDIYPVFDTTGLYEPESFFWLEN